MPTRRATTSTTEIVLEAADEALAVRGRVGLEFGALMMWPLPVLVFRTCTTTRKTFSMCRVDHQSK